ncbi:MAG: Uma2 family endonuclease [Chloroflexi bacterium]|nr:MAG: Uma2 family endonuclease [Chloroflexota bacterium]
MLPEEKKQYYTVDEYFALEETAEYRSEYYQGEIFALAGGSANHNRIAGNVFVALSNALRAKPCEAFVSDLRLWVKQVGLYTYPDVMVVCGGLEFAHERTDTITNPTVIFEVLSPSTENYDRGKKFEFYRTLETLKEYVLIDQERIHVEHYRLLEEGRWLLTVFDDEAGTLTLESIGIEIPVSDMYERVDWEAR